MAASPTVLFDSVWKMFRRGEYHDSLRDLIPALIKRAVGASSGLAENEFWAVRDVSFAVRPGEALGIVGSNGAGKSTILKLLTRILRPTQGHCRVTGRVGALIEVASSFHPDLTGRENVFLQGAIMGMKYGEISRRFDEIVAFAEVADFIDTPVKRYSNGMNARLGFSVAAHLDPQVLIIDEVLSVGDRAFQERCLQRMQHFKRAGAAVVFVSHDVSAVLSLCDSAIVLQGGRAQFAGPTTAAIEQYLRLSRDDVTAPAGAAVIERVRVVDAAGGPVSACVPGAEVQVIADVRFREAARDIVFGLAVHQTGSNVCAYSVDSRALDLAPFRAERGDIFEIAFTLQAHLTRGHYLIDLCATSHVSDAVFAHSRPAAFLLVDENATLAGVAGLGARCRVRVANQVAELLAPRPGWAARAIDVRVSG